MNIGLFDIVILYIKLNILPLYQFDFQKSIIIYSFSLQKFHHSTSAILLKPGGLF